MAKMSGWPGGVNNIAPDTAMPTDEIGNAICLRDAVNVDVLNKGLLRLRPGIAQAIDSSGAHSVYATKTMMVWATATTLHMADVNLLTTTLLTSALLAKPISWEDVNGDIYFSNEDINGIIRADGTYEPWGLEVPAEAPNINGIVTGPNLFSITCTFVTESGQESGAPVGKSTYCSDNPSFFISSIPQPTDNRITHVRLYMTNIDAVEFQQVIDLPVGILAYSLSGFFAYGNVLRTQFMVPPPAGQLIKLHDGVIYIASGSNVFHTEPLNYGLYDPEKDFFMYPERVTLLASNSGLYAAADQLYYLSSPATDNVEQADVMPYRVVEGASCTLPESKDIMAMTDRGFARLKPGGEVVNITEKNIAVDTYSRGAMGYTSVGGHKAIVAMFKNPIPSTEVSKDYTDDITTRKQVEVKF